ncbi:UNVERIFIED_CONTAM: hypothetical protein HDU68_002438 [Siphonaria sp. JEL0065]|nr:hypothetical protein HDU68_002438 [Siphonaria sp. JEL0065]
MQQDQESVGVFEFLKGGSEKKKEKKDKRKEVHEDEVVVSLDDGKSSALFLDTSVLDEDVDFDDNDDSDADMDVVGSGVGSGVVSGNDTPIDLTGDDPPVIVIDDDDDDLDAKRDETPPTNNATELATGSLNVLDIVGGGIGDSLLNDFGFGGEMFASTSGLNDFSTGIGGSALDGTGLLDFSSFGSLGGLDLSLMSGGIGSGANESTENGDQDADIGENDF